MPHQLHEMQLMRWGEVHVKWCLTLYRDFGAENENDGGRIHEITGFAFANPERKRAIL
jgi:hypothetical protein